MPARRFAFSLLELLIVIVIIAIIASLLAVAVHNARERARSTHCLNNLRQLALGFRLYADAHSGKFPDGQRDPWFVKIAPLLESNEAVFRCPSDPQALNLSYGWRDEMILMPTSAVGGKKIDHVANSELVIVFDQLVGWHAPEMVNAAMLNSASLSMHEDAFEANLLLDSSGGKLFNWDMP